MNYRSDTTGKSFDRLEHQGRFRLGKDLLNFADWRIGLTKYEIPRKADGGKLDYIETVICRTGKPDQKLTKMSPAAVGLPTPVDDDVFIALLTLARQQRFESDLVHFCPAQLLNLLRWDDSQHSYNRLDQSLTRLRAVTLRFEYIWYDKVKAEVDPILTTGILAEAKLVRRRGRKARDVVPDSYVQWTNHLYKSINDGNLSTLDLDVYFSLRRPGSRFLFRHLNKRWHGKRKHEPYERDLRDLACGHLGMKQSKDLKRNFEAIVNELQTSGYLDSDSVHFIKVRPGQYRVRFQPQAMSNHNPSSTSSQTESTSETTEEATIVRTFHRLFFDNPMQHITNGELRVAQQLVDQHGATLINKLLPKLVKRVKSKWPDCKSFSGARRYFDDVLKEYQKSQRIDERRHTEDLVRLKQDEAAARSKQKRAERRRRSLAAWSELPDPEKHKIRKEAIAAQNSDFLRRRIREHSDLSTPSREVLEYLAHARRF